MSLGSSVSVVTRLGAVRKRNHGSIPDLRMMLTTLSSSPSVKEWRYTFIPPMRLHVMQTQLYHGFRKKLPLSPRSGFEVST